MNVCINHNHEIDCGIFVGDSLKIVWPFSFNFWLIFIFLNSHEFPRFIVQSTN